MYEKTEKKTGIDRPAMHVSRCYRWPSGIHWTIVCLYNFPMHFNAHSLFERCTRQISKCGAQGCRNLSKNVVLHLKTFFSFFFFIEILYWDRQICSAMLMVVDVIIVYILLFCSMLTMNNAVILHLGHSDFGHFDRYQEWSRTTEQWSNFNWWHNFLVFPRLSAITEPFVRRQRCWTMQAMWWTCEKIINRKKKNSRRKRKRIASCNLISGRNIVCRRNQCVPAITARFLCCTKELWNDRHTQCTNKLNAYFDLWRESEAAQRSLMFHFAAPTKSIDFWPDSIGVWLGGRLLASRIRINHKLKTNKYKAPNHTHTPPLN